MAVKNLDQHNRIRRALREKFFGLEVNIVCGDPVVVVGEAWLVKLDGASPEGARLREWWNAVWRGAEEEDARAH